MGMLNGAPVQHGLPGATTAEMLAALIRTLGPQERDALALELGSPAPVTAPAEGGSGGGKGRRVATAPGYGDLPDGIAYDPTAGTIRGQMSARGRTSSITSPIAGHDIADVVKAVRLLLDAARLLREALELVPDLALRARDLAAQVCGQFVSATAYPSTRKMRAVGPTPSRIRP